MNKIDLDKLFLIGNEIDEMVERDNIDYIDACITYCEQNEIEIEYIGDILKKNQNIKSKILKEAERLNYVKKINRVKID